MSFILKMLSNKVTIYILTRYLVYFISFVTSLIIAGKLGPYYLGVWGAILLFLKYFHIIDFGIGNSVTVLLVQNKEDISKRDNYEKNSMLILALMSIIVCLLGLYYFFFGIPILDKYNFGGLFYFICIIIILQYFNDYFLKVSRVKGRMFEFTFYQTIIQVLTFCAVFFAKEARLINVLVGVYLLSHLLSLFIYIKGGSISFKGKYNFNIVKELLGKGFFLFIYNFCFYMIIISTQTIVGVYYSVEEFGYFSFSYTLAHAALLLLTAFSSLITPKLIDKLNSNDNKVIESTIKVIRINYVSLSHCLMYLAMAFFPIILYFLPKYAGTLEVINFTSLATILYTNSFGYISFLMARNREKQIASNSLICFLVNVVIALFLALVLKVEYTYVILATMFSYLLYAYCIVYYGKKDLFKRDVGFIEIMKDVFPIKILIPYIVAILISIINNQYIMGVPFLLFIIINYKEIFEIIKSVKKIIYNPNIIDVK